MTDEVLIVDDEKNMRWALSEALVDEGYRVITGKNGEEAYQLTKENQPDVIILDDKMPKESGMEVLPKLKDDFSQIPIIMITAHGSIESAVEAMKLGADDYITKPFQIKQVKMTLEQVRHIKKLEEENKALRQELGKEMVGESKELKKVFNLIDKVAPEDTTVLITGESGTGKELAARAIHRHSLRCEEPYVIVNCAAIPNDLLESEFFGHVKGAFTSADSSREGRIIKADGGTLFLDEIGELAEPLQAKLLRFLQEGTFKPVGSDELQEADVRIIAATNKDLEKEVKEGRFREDLYYRLNIFPIKMPPLRERKTDIPLLAEHFLKRYDSNQRFKGFSQKAIDLMKEYEWPGNVRELENVVERATIVCQDAEISADCLPSKINQELEESEVPWILPEDGISLSEVEKSLIKQALIKSDGNQSQAARLLSITRHTLRYRMQKYGLTNSVQSKSV